MRLTTLHKMFFCSVIALACLAGSGQALRAAQASDYRIIYIFFDGQIWTMAPDGSDQRVLTHSPWGANEPLPSPDGKHIAYFANLWEATNQYYSPYLSTIDIDGQNEGVLLRAKEESVADADWSPDSQKLAFTSCPRPDCRVRDLYIINRDGSGRVKLTDDRLPREQGRVSIASPRWSPDGQSIVFSLFDSDTKASLYIVSVDGKRLTRLIGNLEGFVVNPHPTWTPDGKSIVFLNYPELYIIGADGSGVRQITHFEGIYPSVYGVAYARYGRPFYTISPDNKAVLTTFGYGADGVEILRIDLAPGGWDKRTLLHADRNRLRNAFWSPDGQSIFFERDQSDGMTICRMNADGGDVTPLAKGILATAVRMN